MTQTDSIVKVLWGIVNAAYSGFSDLAEAVAWAQSDDNGYKTVYIPPGEYLLDDKTIDIHTSGFTLQGAGEGSTILKASRTFETASWFGHTSDGQFPFTETRMIPQFVAMTTAITGEMGKLINFHS